MKFFNWRVLLFVATAAWIAQATMLASFAQEVGQLRQEASTLENLYQDKVHNILNNLMNSEDYTLVISATIRNDETRLKEYADALEKKFLPGLIITDPMGYNDAHNILLELKQKIEIQVILTENVPADRDNLVREILKSKLHLNEESGDTVTVVRASRSIASINPAPAPKMAELSARMIAFWIIVGLLATTALALWLYRRKEKAKEKAREEQEAEEKEKPANAASTEISKEDSEKEDKEPEVVIKTQEEIEAERDALEMKLAFAKGELVKIVREYPSIVCRAVEEFVAQGKINDTVNFLESLGWDQSRKLFKDVDSRLWTRVGAALRERDRDPTLEESYNAVHVFHRFALSFVLERAGRDSENPFSFIFQLSDSQRIDLLAHEKAYNIALVSIYCSGPQMGELLNGLEQRKQREVLLEIAKIKQLPETEIRESVDALLMRLERIKADPSVHVDGSILAADFMRSLPPAREEELYQTLLTQHPAEAEKLRRVRVMFQDVPYYPSEMVKKVIESLDSEEILKSLVGFNSQFAEAFLALLPTKKALMIQNDLYHMTEFPPVSQCAENRRKVCMKLEAEFEAQRFKVAEYWKNFDQPEVESAAPAPAQDEVTSIMDNPVIFNDEPGDGEEAA
jgi:flagellar motor switch protein FliG